MPMHPAIVENLNFNLGFIGSILDKTPDDAFYISPAPGVHPIAWQLGHLTIALYGAARLLGGPDAAPEGMREMYGIGSTPSEDPAANLSPEALREQYRLAGEAVNAAAVSADDAWLASSNPNEGLREGLPTVEAMVAFLTGGHLTYHGGQLASCRRAQGHGSALGF